MASTATAIEPLYADNDFDYTTYLEDIDQTNAHREPVVEGDITAWLVGAANADAAAAMNDPIHESLVATVAHVGVDPVVDEDDQPVGTWLIHMDKNILTRATLDPVFAAAIAPATTILKPFLIVDDPAGARVALPLKYHKSRPAVVA